MVEAKEKIEAGRFVYRLFFCPRTPNCFCHLPGPYKIIQTFLGCATFASFLLGTLAWTPSKSQAQTRVSLRQYEAKAVLISNPFDITDAVQGTTYQVNHRDFILQFFFTGQNIQGVVMKREKTLPIHIRWCFFRTCEASSFDYKAVLAQGYQRPYAEDSFQVRLPVKFNYHFQGIHFSSGMSPIPFR